MVTRLPALLVLGGLLAVVTPAPAQDDNAPGTVRTLYVVRHGDAKAMADVLAKHYKGEAEVSTLPGGNQQALLISARPAVITDLVKLLGELDRAPRMIEVELLLVEVSSTKEKADREFTGPEKEVAARIDDLTRAGRVVSLQRVRLTAVDGHPVSMQNGANKPITTGKSRTATGIAQRSVTYMSVGTTIRLTARAAGDSVGVELDLKDSQVRKPEGAEEDAAPAIENTSLTTKLSIPPRQAVAAQAVKADAKAGGTLSLVIVTAREIAPTRGK